MSEITLLEAAKAMSRALWNCRYEEVVLNKFDLAWQTLHAAIEREEQRAQWRPGDKAIAYGEDPTVIADAQEISTHSVRPDGSINCLYHSVAVENLRRPTPEELANWPGGAGDEAR